MQMFQDAEHGDDVKTARFPGNLVQGGIVDAAFRGPSGVRCGWLVWLQAGNCPTANPLGFDQELASAAAKIQEVALGLNRFQTAEDSSKPKTVAGSVPAVVVADCGLGISAIHVTHGLGGKPRRDVHQAAARAFSDP
jgi:hypothetical protein